VRVLVTRPIDDAEETAAALRLRGHEALVAPLLSVHFHDGPEISLDGVQAVLATSANGVRALARRTTRRDVPIFAVGPQTEDAARALGFAAVKNADGNAVSLAQAAGNWAEPGKGVLFHARGEAGESKLAALLTAQGFKIESAVLYDVAAVEHLPPAALDALKKNALDAALFFSPRSARVLRDGMALAGLSASQLLALCISEATAGALWPLNFREIRVAVAPNQESLLACLD
jgi:uroporphyrinogen-III synthase